MLILLPADRSFGKATSNSSPLVPDPGKVDKYKLCQEISKKINLHVLVAFCRENNHLFPKIPPHGQLVGADMNLFENIRKCATLGDAKSLAVLDMKRLSESKSEKIIG